MWNMSIGHCTIWSKATHKRHPVSNAAFMDHAQLWKLNININKIIQCIIRGTRLCILLIYAPWSLMSYLKAWVRQSCQLAFSSATTATFPSSFCMGASLFISQWGEGLQILEAWSSRSTIRLTCEAQSRLGRAAYSHSVERGCIVLPWMAGLNLPDDKVVK